MGDKRVVLFRACQGTVVVAAAQLDYIAACLQMRHGMDVLSFQGDRASPWGALLAAHTGALRMGSGALYPLQSMCIHTYVL